LTLKVILNFLKSCKLLLHSSGLRWELAVSDLGVAYKVAELQHFLSPKHKLDHKH